MDARIAFGALLNGLIDVFAAERREGGYLAASALASVLPFKAELPAPNARYEETLREALGDAPDKVGTLISGAAPFLRWDNPQSTLAEIPNEIADNMANVELLGPDGMIKHDRVRIGLYLQLPNTDYGQRTHPAEECFFMIGGEGLWSRADETPVLCKSGDYIYHASNIPHACKTFDRPFLTAWRWSGDINTDGYSFNK